MGSAKGSSVARPGLPANEPHAAAVATVGGRAPTTQTAQQSGSGFYNMNAPPKSGSTPFTTETTHGRRIMKRIIPDPRVGRRSGRGSTLWPLHQTVQVRPHPLSSSPDQGAGP